MPVFLEPGQTGFPPLRHASAEGLLAVGGDLSRRRLLQAYASGIFPWYDETTPILWWAPPQRCVLPPAELHVPRSLRRAIRARPFAITLDRAFLDVIRSCAGTPRPGQKGTWLTREMIGAYSNLHRAGWAHSVEAWQDGGLVGGVYGVSLGGIFFGESMFFSRPDASKICLVWLVRLLHAWGFTLIDCQQVTDNLLRFGARPIPRADFMKQLASALALPTRRGLWSMPEGFFPV